MSDWLLLPAPPCFRQTVLALCSAGCGWRQLTPPHRAGPAQCGHISGIQTHLTSHLSTVTHHTSALSHLITQNPGWNHDNYYLTESDIRFKIVGNSVWIPQSIAEWCKGCTPGTTLRCSSALFLNPSGHYELHFDQL